MRTLLLACVVAGWAGSAGAQRCVRDTNGVYSACPDTLGAGAQLSAADANWHLLTKSYSGTVSLLNGLSADECQKISAHLRGMPYGDAEVKKFMDELKAKNPTCPDEGANWDAWHKANWWAEGCVRADGSSMSWGGGRIIDKGDIETAECFQ